MQVKFVVPLDVLREACKEVYETMLGLIGTPEGNQRLGIGAGGDLSRKIDIEAEEAVIRTVRRFGLCPTIIGEECGTVSGKEGYLVIDPIDGTTNAAARICLGKQTEFSGARGRYGSISR